MKAIDAIKSQQETIALAIAILESQLEEMTNAVSPEKANWKDVSQFAHIADMAGRLIQDFNDSNAE